MKHQKGSQSSATYEGLHTCGPHCARIECVQRREIESLRADLDWHKASHDKQADTIVRIGRKSHNMRSALEAVVAHLLPENLRSPERMATLSDPWRAVSAAMLDKDLP
jgi:hypothetical protein